MNFKNGILVLLFATSAWASMPTPVPTPAEIPSLLKPEYVPKRLNDYDDKPIMVLLEVEKQREIWGSRAKATPVKVASLLPNHVYLYYLPRENRWHQVLTDSFGKLKRNPMEYLRASTIVPGPYLGGKAGQNYVLGRDKLWLPTFKSERYEFWVDGNPPLAKYVEFEPLVKK